ncbi:hypothetical protein CBS101457_004877 [Exobasidium rhododendri]|nr:hypothetical protein CBS101457_004877 [Exobasidium rhododendri]
MSMTIEDCSTPRQPRPVPDTPFNVLEQLSMKGRLVCITGASSGIGSSVAEAMAEAGADLALWYNSNDAAIAKGAELAKKHNIKAKAYQVEITNIAQVQTTMAQVVEDFGKLDVFVANAGMAISKPILEQTIEEYKQQMAVNVDGVFYCAKYAGKAFKKQGSGNFIITSSMSAHIVNVPVDQPVYNLTKAAVTHLGKSLAREWREFARVNIVSPGFFDTNLGASPRCINEAYRMSALGRQGHIKELKGLYLYLASDASSYQTGSDTLIDALLATFAASSDAYADQDVGSIAWPTLEAVNTTTTIGSNATQSQGNDSAPFPNSYYPDASAADLFDIASFNDTSPPKYPSPWMTGKGDWAESYSKAVAFVSQLTLTEKVNLTTGTGWETQSCVGQTGSVPRLGFRSLCLQDSPVGIRDTDYNSVFPAGGTIAASFDKKLMRERGYDMGSEFRDKGIDVQLGPVVGPLGRSPEAGRGWEGFSPDPVLSGIAAAETIKGIQSAGVIATIKHFIGNEQEHFRQVGEAVGYGYNITEASSSNIDDVTLHELYLWPFADAVKAGSAAAMCSYNQVNNSYSCQNSYLLNHLLKGELGFQGFVMSDWQAQHAGVSGALAGLDMAMPGDTLFDSGVAYWASNLTIAVLNGTMPMWRLDDMAVRIVAAWYYVDREANQKPINFNSWTLATNGYKYYASQEDFGVVNEHVDVRQQHGKAIRRMAARSTVLLKNVNKTLPLGDSEKFTAVFGSDSSDSHIGANGCSDRGCDNGTLGMGWGSGSANFPYLVTPLRAITNQVTEHGNGIVQAITDDYAYDQIIALAPQASVAIVFVNADSGEGFISVDGNEGDRQNLTLWHNGDDLIANVTAYNNNTVVVIHSGGAVEMGSFVDNPNVTAILWAGLPGEQSGHSIVDVLYGKVNPAGRLPFTMGRSRQDYGTDILYNPNNGVDAPQIVFGEGPFIDYRGFDRRNVTPIFEFGFGLSYTAFRFSNLTVQQHYPGPYLPQHGSRGPAPTFGDSVGNASDYLVPTNFTRLAFPYLYPYLNSTDLQSSSGASDYGLASDEWLPSGAANGSSYDVLPAGGAPGGNPGLYDVLFTITASITNKGKVAGDEVVQLYVSLGGPRDAKVALRGFERLCDLQPGETRLFEANLTRRDLSNWDTIAQDWFVSKHTKTIHVGKSSRNFELTQVLPSAH